MKKLPLFEDFIPVGFGSNSISAYTLGASPNMDTGYNMNAIVGPVTELVNCVANEAYVYDSNENPEHTAESYAKEAKQYINNKIDEACSRKNENKNIIPGGLADKLTVKDLATKHKLSVSEIEDAIKKGQKVELEHTNDPAVAYEIAKDHIFEDPAYYDKLAKIEEANDYEYKPGDHAERLKRREKQNIERYRAAQDRGDNYAIALYELRIKLDKIDLEKIKVLKAIDDLKRKFDKI